MPYTLQQPSIPFKPRNQMQEWIRTKPVREPMKGVKVRCMLRGIGHPAKWETGRLHFTPNQKRVPVVISDSMGQDLVRHPTAIQIVREGATVAQMLECLKERLDEIREWCPIKEFWVIFAGGGNNLCKQCT